MRCKSDAARVASRQVSSWIIADPLAKTPTFVVPGEIVLSKAIGVNGTNVILIDDVANSGRTMFYALQPLLRDHPGQVETLALLERTHKQFPIELNYVGHSVSTTKDEMIVVKVNEGEVEGACFKS